MIDIQARILPPSVPSRPERFPGDGSSAAAPVSRPISMDEQREEENALARWEDDGGRCRAEVP